MSDDEIIDAEVVEQTALEVAGRGEVAELGGLAEIRKVILGLDDARQELAEAGDVPGLAYGAADIAVIVKDLGTVARQARIDIAKLLVERHPKKNEQGQPIGRPKTEVEGLGVIEVPGGKERKGWESERLLKFLMRHAVADPETGELRDLTAGEMVEAIYEVLNECLPITGSLGWRIGKAAKGEAPASGLLRYTDPDDWCEHVDKERIAKMPSGGLS